MRLSAPRLELDEGWATTAVTASSPSCPEAELAISVPRSAIGAIDPGVTPFLPIASVLAGFLGEDLEVETPISPVAAAGAESALKLMHEWWSAHPVRIVGPREKPPYPPGDGTGLFYTRGVDSTFSLLRHSSGERQPELTHLIGITGLDHWIAPTTRARIWHDTETAARRAGLPLLRAHTEVRAVLDPVVEWLWSHGAVLASVALLYAPLLRTVLIGSTRRADLAEPLGTHPALDHRWSSERCTLLHDGAELSRYAKTARIAQDPEALRDLKVCWESDTESNCGRCYKCLITMSALAGAGVPTEGLFEEELTAEAIRGIRRGRYFTFINELIDELPPRTEWIRRAWVDRLHAAELRTHDEDEGAPELTVPLRSRALSTPDPVDRLREVEVAAGFVVTSDAEDSDSPHYGWVPGRVPLRLPRSEAFDHVCRDPADWEERPTAWCLVDRATPATVALAERLTEEWGEGICYLPGVLFAPEQPPALPPEAVAPLLRASRARVWWSEEDDLDAVRLYESVANGCAPFQAMPIGAAEMLRAQLPVRLRSTLLGIPETGPFPAPDPARLRAVLVDARVEMVTGSLERDHLVGPHR